jgi:hypothetical protein
MSALPPPPAPPEAHPLAAEPTPRRAGQLTQAWQSVFVVGWVGVIVSFSAIWRSTRTMGLSTWWLGASSTPQPLVVQLVPFYIGIAMVVLGARSTRHLPYLGIVGALLLAGVAAGDIDRFHRLAAAEMIVAGAALLLSIATLAGLLRPADAASDAGQVTTAVSQ